MVRRSSCDSFGGTSINPPNLLRSCHANQRLFDLENRCASLSEAGDPLERLDAVIDWEIFRPIPERIDAKERKSAAGRKPTWRILMFKMLILQRLHNLSDERLQFQVTDRLSFMRFLGLELSGDVPDARTVWAFREALKVHWLVEPLFGRLNQALADLGVELKSGQIIDAPPSSPSRSSATGAKTTPSSNRMPSPSTGARPRPSSRRKGHRRALDQERRAEPLWVQEPHQHRPRHQTHRGARHHARPCPRDSQVLDAVLRPQGEGGKEVWGADSAYRSDEQEQSLKGSRHESRIHERAYRNTPLSEAQELSNTEKSRVRARVEHVFGHMENSMGGIFLKTIGAARAKVGVGLMNLTYNLKRIETLIRLKMFSFDRIVAPGMRGIV